MESRYLFTLQSAGADTREFCTERRSGKPSFEIEQLTAVDDKWSIMTIGILLRRKEMLRNDDICQTKSIMLNRVHRK